MKNTNLIGIAGAACIGAALLWTASLQVAMQPARSLAEQPVSDTTQAISAQPTEDKLQALLQGQGVAMPPPAYTLQQLKERNQRARQLYAIWMTRQQRDADAVAAEIVPYLRDEDGNIRISAARCLGKLESVVGEAALSQQQQEMESLYRQQKSEEANKIGIGSFTALKIMRGRIASRGLRGRAGWKR